MPAFAATLIGYLALAAASLTGRVLLALGISFVSYTGITVVLDGLKSGIQTQMGELSGTILQVLAVCQVDTVVAMLFSAYSARLVLMGLTSGALKRMVTK